MFFVGFVLFLSGRFLLLLVSFSSSSSSVVILFFCLSFYSLFSSLSRFFLYFFFKYLSRDSRLFYLLFFPISIFVSHLICFVFFSLPLSFFCLTLFYIIEAVTCIKQFFFQKHEFLFVFLRGRLQSIIFEDTLREINHLTSLSFFSPLLRRNVHFFKEPEL